MFIDEGKQSEMHLCNNSDIADIITLAEAAVTVAATNAVGL
jgi:hypothetical protein